MGMKCAEILKHMEALAPQELALDWDNVGLIVGNSESIVDTVLIALDVTNEVIEEAIKLKAQLIITHHPMIFKPINKINNTTPTGRNILTLIKNEISVYSSHTNLDISNQGTNDTLFNLLNLENKNHLMECDKQGYSLGRVGSLKERSKLKDFSKYVKDSLNLTSIRFTGNEDKLISKVGLCTGASSSYEMFKKAKEKGCDVFITGDIKFHEAQIAIEMDMCLIDATHYASEVIVIQDLRRYLVNMLKDSNINVVASQVNGQTFKNI